MFSFRLIFLARLCALIDWLIDCRMKGVAAQCRWTRRQWAWTGSAVSLSTHCWRLNARLQWPLPRSLKRHRTGHHNDAVPSSRCELLSARTVLVARYEQNLSVYVVYVSRVFFCQHVYCFASGSVGCLSMCLLHPTSMCLCVYVIQYMPSYMSMCLSVLQLACLYLMFRLYSVCLSMYPSTWLYIFLSTCLSVRFVVCLLLLLDWSALKLYPKFSRFPCSMPMRWMTCGWPSAIRATRDVPAKASCRGRCFSVKSH